MPVKMTASGTQSLSAFAFPMTTGSSRVYHTPVPDIFESIYASSHQRGWDGEDAIPITLQTIHLARRVLSELHQHGRALKPNISPGADGTIGFEMHNIGGAVRKIFIEARPDEFVRAYWVTSANEFFDVEPTAASSALYKLRNVLKTFAIEGEALE